MRLNMNDARNALLLAVIRAGARVSKMDLSKHDGPGGAQVAFKVLDEEIKVACDALDGKGVIRGKV